ncbi:MAG: glutamate--tRNA ligase [Oscillospiraceae bacterium]|nr:glutamate--tRNA ligase [Oscillospiraceae bacterium]
MSNKVRTRFAPSPTGYMHIGNLRTALYAYLISKKNNGDFILRIEDTDQERLVEGAIDIIYKTLKKANLQWDEGPDIGGHFAPYIQSERLHMYKKYAMELIENNNAYFCFCDKEHLEEVRKIQQASGITPKYDGHCKNLSEISIKQKLDENIPFVIRQKMPKEGETSFDDAVFGTITVENSILDDQILIKTDGMPTYNFANVVDDHTMGITHIVRGNEYLSSTPKYNLLYEAFGWEKPVYIHCSPVMKTHTEKLSKRNGDASFEDFIEKGFLPEAIVNYIVLLGWSPKGEEEIFTLSQLISEFNIEGISKSPAIFDDKKLKSINGEYIRKLSLEAFSKFATPYIRQTCENKNLSIPLISQVLQKRTELFSDIPDQVDFFDKLPEYDISLYINKKMKTTYQSSLDILNKIIPIFEDISNWTLQNIHDSSFNLIKEMEVKNGIVLWPIRVSTSGKQFTPGGGIEIAEILGKEETINRIKIGIEKLSNI